MRRVASSVVVMVEYLAVVWVVDSDALWVVVKVVSMGVPWVDSTVARTVVVMAGPRAAL